MNEKFFFFNFQVDVSRLVFMIGMPAHDMDNLVQD